MDDNNDTVAYDFVQLGEKLATTLMQAAEEQVNRAQIVLDQTRAMADIIRTQVVAQATQIGEMNGRFRAFGEQMLDAHRMLNGNGPVIRERTRQLGAESQAVELDKLRDLADARRNGGDQAHHDNTVARNLLDIGRRPERGDERVELPREVATGEPHPPWAGYSHYYDEDRVRAAGTDDGGVDFSKISRKGGTDSSGGRETAPAAASPPREKRTRD